MPRVLQIYPQAATVRGFLKKIESAHHAAASRGFMCQVLHYSPCTMGKENPERQTSRVEPSGLEDYRRDHEFQAPTCLCALIDGVPYTETRIGLVERGEHRGAYAAECAAKRCGYIVYLDDFYTVLGLRMKKYARRETPLDFNQALENDDRDSQVEGGLLGLIAKLLESEGVDERRFWKIIKQCDQCRRIMRKRSYLKHRCRGPRQAVAQLSEKWVEENVIDLTQED
ncbi:hypothetical protein BKA70DRAFT_1452232 [Coprinopsis sp. MPI-PUGE-AT-0042]|nr:hypothetical protein BKA70DRAFT_1452232 [Coprinopsis sp. MPI-PUGE-AT-0042]